MKLLDGIAFLLAATFCCAAQSSVGDLRRDHKAISATGTVKLEVLCKNREDVRFHLSNMTEGAISLRTFSLYVHPTRYKRYQLLNGRRVFLLPADQKIPSLIYTVEETRNIGGKPFIQTRSSGMDNFSQSWLAPRDAILFDVPMSYSNEDSRLYVYFKYEWDVDEKGTVKGGAVEHRALHPGLSTEDKVPACN